MAFINYDVEMLSRYLDTMEAQLEEARNLELSELSARPPEKIDEPDFDREAVEQAHEEFLRFQRYAFLMLSFMVFEARAKEFCKIVGSDKHLPLGLKDFDGKLVQKLKLFLCRYSNVLDNEWQLWEDLQNLQIVRNQIVHQNGICPKDEVERKFKPLERKVTGLQIEQGSEGFQIQLSLNCCRCIVSTIKKFFEEASRKAGFSN
jgi:hypothetical protein